MHSLSVVVEWDNVRYYEVARATRMLQRLVDQLGGLAAEPAARPPAEILVLYDEEAIDAATVNRALDGFVGRLPAGVELRGVGTRGLRYYQLKNEGARRGTGEIILFADSDVLPEDGWLAELLMPFEDPAVHAVIANAYIDRDSLYSKTFALAWYFPARAKDGPLAVTRSSMVNSMAIRRTTFARFPFPDDRELYIQQCVAWARNLRAHGIEIHRNPRARIAHPPPSFLRSALIQGHDTIVTYQRRAGRSPAWRTTYWSLRSQLAGSLAAVVRDHREVGLPRAAIPLALGIATTYYVLWALSEWATRWRPGIVRRLYGI